MKKVISIICLMLTVVFMLCSCKVTIGGSTSTVVDTSGSGNTGNTSGSKDTSKGGNSSQGGSSEQKVVTHDPTNYMMPLTFNMPAKLMTTDEYHKEIDNLLKVQNLSVATSDYMKKLDEIDKKLEDQIRYDQGSLECKGTKYYVAANGNDNNDGKSPEKPWKTIKKVNTASYKKGDVVYFKRGDTFRGIVRPISGVSYSAYGSGFKPNIWGSYDAKQWKWVETDTKNVWKLDHKFSEDPCQNYGLPFKLDMAKELYVSGLVFPDGAETCGTRCYWLKDLDKNYEFCYRGPVYNIKKDNLDKDNTNDRYIYMYCDQGNPNDIFKYIEIGLNSSVFNEDNIYIEDVHLDNLDLRYGRGPFWPGDCRNISVTYCICAWEGGFDDGTQGVPYGGGGGVYGFCDYFLWDHCYIYQQWDSGVSPQLRQNRKETVIMKDFITTNCIFKGCRWTLEYWLDQPNSNDDRIEHLVFNYNLCRDNGSGFNPTKGDSAYVMSWAYQNSCFNCEIKHNLFDRATAYTLSIAGYDMSTGTKVLSYDRIPKLGNNIYLQKKNKKFAMIQGTNYKYTENDIKTYAGIGFDTGSVFLFAE